MGDRCKGCHDILCDNIKDCPSCGHRVYEEALEIKIGRLVKEIKYDNWLSDNFMKIYFSINDYDKDGDIYTSGIFLHFKDTRIRIADDMDGYDKFIKHLQNIREEIVETYNE